MHRRPRSVARMEDGQEGFLAGEAEAVRVWLLGGFQVLVGSRKVDEGEWRLKKARSLIKLLALAPGHRMHREMVMDRLWPDLGRAEAANNLRRVLYVSRRAFEPSPATPYRYLRLKDEELALCSDGPLWVDVEAFEEAAETARRIREPAAYRVALELYSGELLPEDCYEEWAEGRREELRRLYLVLLCEMAVVHEERKEHDEAIEALRRVLSHEPVREEAHAGLMRLYALCGRRGEALKQCERLKESLSRELGTEPAPYSQRLCEQIASGRFPPTTAPSSEDALAEEISNGGPHNLPAAPDVFVGREREIIEVKRALSMTNLLTLTGTGGSGKTRLALEIARELVGFYPDGVWLVELTPLSEGELVPQAVAGALGVREQPGRPLADTLVDVLRTKRMLLVLDNCEHLIDAAARLANMLLTSCPRLRVLATSREPLSVAGETVWRCHPCRCLTQGAHPPPRTSCATSRSGSFWSAPARGCPPSK